MRMCFLILFWISSCYASGVTLSIVPGDQVIPVSGKLVRLEFQTNASLYYQIESSQDLNFWQKEGYAFRGTGALVSVLVTDKSLPSLFYRVRDNASASEITPINPYGLSLAIGIAGPQGPAGPAGPIGSQGIAGPLGPTGAIGPKGEQGVQGPPGSGGGIATISAQDIANALGYVPLPNGESARRPQFYDDFSFWPDASVISDGTQPIIGRSYRFVAGTAQNATVMGGALRPSGETLYYMGTELDGPVESIGVELSYIENPQQTNLEADLTLLIGSYENWPGRPIIHIRLRRNQVAVEVGTSTAFTQIFQKASTLPNRPAFIRSVSTVSIRGDTLVIVHESQRHVIKDQRIADINGKYVFFETGTGPPYNAFPILHKIWANAPSIGGSTGIGVQPYSDALDRIARGSPVFPGQLAVGANSNMGFNDSLVVNGRIRAVGSLIGMWGAQNNSPAPISQGTAPLLINAITTPVRSQAGPAAGSIQTVSLSPGYLSTIGSSMRFKYIGSSADNSNAKRLGIRLAGSEFWSSDPLPAGTRVWELEILWFSNTAASHNIYVKFTIDGKTSQGWISRNFTSVVNLEVTASGTSVGDITLEGGTTHLDTLLR